MPGYGTLGFDIHLRPKNGLFSRLEYVPGYDFVTDNERGAITRAFMGSASIGNVQLGTAVIGTANIGTLSFNQISGGTAILGGTTNGNGLLSVRNQLGNEIVKLDNTGLTVTNGSVTIQNSGGTNVIDATGLVSTANFSFSGTSNATLRNITSGTDFPIPNGTLVTSSFTRTVNTLINISAQCLIRLPSDTIESAGIKLYIDGTAQENSPFDMAFRDGRVYSLGTTETQSRRYNLYASQIVSLGTGTHNLVIQGQTTGGTLQLLVTNLTYISLGA